MQNLTVKKKVIKKERIIIIKNKKKKKKKKKRDTPKADYNIDLLFLHMRQKGFVFACLLMLNMEIMR